MATTRTGSIQRLGIREPGGAGAYTQLDGEDSGLTGVQLTHTPALFTVTSGGVTVTGDAGTRALALVFQVGETEVSAEWLLGQSGRRAGLLWQPQGDDAGNPQYRCEAIVVVDWQAAAAGIRSFAVAAQVDGPLTESVI